MRLLAFVYITSVLLVYRTFALPHNVTTPLEVQALSTNTSDRLGVETLIPNNFILNFEIFAQVPLHVLAVWPALFQAISYTAEQPFFDILPQRWRFRNSAISIAIEPESRQPGSNEPSNLTHGHMVWALQRLGEKIFQDRVYNELDAEIQIGGQTEGRLELAAKRTPSAAQATQEKVVALDDIDKITLGNFNTSFFGAVIVPGVEQGSGKYNLTGKKSKVGVALGPLRDIRLKTIDTYLFLITAIAALAPNDLDKPLTTHWDWTDQSLGLGFSVKLARTRMSYRPTWRDILFVITSMIKFFLDKRASHFEEIQGKVITGASPDIDHPLATVMLQSLVQDVASEQVVGGEIAQLA